MTTEARDVRGCAEAIELFEFSKSDKVTRGFITLTHHTLERFAGKFDDKRALKLFMNNAKDAARSYAKTYGGTWSTMFNETARRECARLMLQQYKGN